MKSKDRRAFMAANKKAKRAEKIAKKAGKVPPALAVAAATVAQYRKYAG